MADILQRILATKRGEVAVGKRARPLPALRAEAEAMPPPRGFRRALDVATVRGKPAVIAEIKRASPSAGLLREPFDVAAIAKDYAAAGATCLSVLTDEQYFQGQGRNIELARTAASLPALRKDFIVDPWQVYESRVLGADAVLLIVAALDDERLRDLLALAGELELDALVEVHDAAELERALAAEAGLVGINNRDLKSFVTDIGTTVALAARLPADVTTVTESGIRTTADVSRLRTAGVNCFLVGEAFMRAPDPGTELKRLFK
ncbi:MAG TPA: indole-3-glycerol phosphate synthase TrpC [Gammaproteobacteria bacterium]|jgi:indole-3-glycerol phosphate synthase|nr:indole-3-glycerol phosphate synthase TrpC [Gammaproteobacteria bacterium]